MHVFFFSFQMMLIGLVKEAACGYIYQDKIMQETETEDNACMAY